MSEMVAERYKVIIAQCVSIKHIIVIISQLTGSPLVCTLKNSLGAS